MFINSWIPKNSKRLLHSYINERSKSRRKTKIIFLFFRNGAIQHSIWQARISWLAGYYVVDTSTNHEVVVAWKSRSLARKIGGFFKIEHILFTLIISTSISSRCCICMNRNGNPWHATFTKGSFSAIYKLTHKQTIQFNCKILSKIKIWCHRHWCRLVLISDLMPANCEF